jgi:TetR/AcrR family transcriptional regulator, transcriptional repressor for nem operon
VKEFDPDVVLEKALVLFWSKGYEATSVADLVEHVGIGRASLYATYGGKRDLYLKALDRYTRLPGPMEILSRPGPVLPLLRELIDFYVEFAGTDKPNRGCMMTNAAAETGITDSRVARRVSHNWRALEAAVVSALMRAQVQGEIAADKDPRAVGQLLFVLLQGMTVVGKGDPDPDRLRAAGEQALALLT